MTDSKIVMVGDKLPPPVKPQVYIGMSELPNKSGKATITMHKGSKLVRVVQNDDKVYAVHTLIDDPHGPDEVEIEMLVVRGEDRLPSDGMFNYVGTCFILEEEEGFEGSGLVPPGKAPTPFHYFEMVKPPPYIAQPLPQGLPGLPPGFGVPR